MFLSLVPKPDVPEYCYHQFLWTYFDRERLAVRPFVFRPLDSALLMLSREKPLCKSVMLNDRIQAGQIYQFDLICSPQRGTWRDEHGKRHRRTAYQSNQERIGWLKRRLGESAEIRFAHVFDRPKRRFKTGDGHEVAFAECAIRGTLYVNDKAEFIEYLTQGIGSKGAWGLGLLVLPEVMSCA